MPLLLLLAAALAAAPAHARGPHFEVRPELAGFDPLRLAKVDSVIEAALNGGASPGAALVVGRHGRLVRMRGYGYTDWQPGSPFVTDSTLYDLASLTKAMGTATVAMQLVREGTLDLDVPIYRYYSLWPSRGLHARITIRHLLAHTSGLPAGADLWPGRDRTRAERLANLANLPVRTPPGTQRNYSDLGMILLGAVMEEATGSRLDDLLHVRVFAPLAMNDTRFNPLEAGQPNSIFRIGQIAPTERDTYVRKTLVQGVVHDLNAWALDGVAGHAGLFSTARDLATFGLAMLESAAGRETALFARGEFTLWYNQRAFGRPLGWDVPSGPNSAAGRFFTKDSFGHTGFTGTSIWFDPTRDLFVVLLTNRVNPTSANQKHLALRREVHDLVQLAIADAYVEPREP